jgi:hypothetical protein
MLSRITQGHSTATGDGLSKDVLFDILSNPRRRHALHYLKQRDGPVAVGEMAETLAAWEHGTTRSGITSKQRKRVYTSLYQSHLPKMERAGVVEYDRPRGMVDLTAAAGELEIYLDVVARNDVPWSVFYLGLSGLLTGVVLALLVEAAPVSFASPLAWMGAFAALFLSCSAAHVVLDRKTALGNALRPPDVPELVDDREARR